jgi:2-iminobutanoate/2-iminopropanoate deaminase
MKSVVLMIGLVVAALSAPALHAREYLKSERAQQRGFTPGVVTEGGKIVWVSGQTGLVRRI